MHRFVVFLKLQRFLLYLFTAAEIKLLGFAFTEDERHLQPLCPSLPHPLAVVDLQKELKSYLKQKNPPSLSLACKYAFGYKLRKIEQCSNWERRPLREMQLKYAAIDAWCLTGIYAWLKTEERAHSS